MDRNATTIKISKALEKHINPTANREFIKSLKEQESKSNGTV